ncbi:MAG: hypothetical protein KUG77_29720, partial [Nannocystaceae bacterium]|nr:hypothetical protein [Nannocystaceae bacterium]
MKPFDHDPGPGIGEKTSRLVLEHVVLAQRAFDRDVEEFVVGHRVQEKVGQSLSNLEVVERDDIAVGFGACLLYTSDAADD